MAISVPVFKEFADAQALNSQLAERIAQALQQGVDERGAASLVVSGGRTPIALFSELSQQRIDWSRVYITLADERWVDVQDESSNEKLVRAHLLQGFAASAHFCGLKNHKRHEYKGSIFCIYQNEFHFCSVPPAQFLLSGLFELLLFPVLLF